MLFASKGKLYLAEKTAEGLYPQVVIKNHADGTYTVTTVDGGALQEKPHHREVLTNKEAAAKYGTSTVSLATEPAAAPAKAPKKSREQE